MFLDLLHILLLMLMETVASLPQLKVNFEFMDSSFNTLYCYFK